MPAETENQLDLMECPVCLLLPRRGPIYSCRNGHMMCKDCQPKVTACPLCRDTETACRNLFAEKVLENTLKDYLLNCRFSAHGCKRKGQISDIEKHEVYECEYRTVTCPGSRCGWVGNLNELIEHVKDKKCVKIISPNPSDFCYVSSIQVSETKDKISVFSCTTDLTWGPSLLINQDPEKNFHIVKIFRDGSGYWYFYIKLLTKVKRTLRMEIRVQKPGENRNHFIYTGEVASKEDSEKDILEKGNCLMLRDSQIKKLKGENRNLEYSIRFLPEQNSTIGKFCEVIVFLVFFIIFLIGFLTIIFVIFF